MRRTIECASSTQGACANATYRYWLGCVGQAFFRGVRHDSDDPRTSVFDVAADRPADGIDSREVLPGKCFVDDDDTFGSHPVVDTDRAAAAKGEAKALEIAGRHDSVFGGRVLDLRAFVDTQARPVPAAAQRQHLPGADGGHAGKLT